MHIGQNLYIQALVITAITLAFLSAVLLRVRGKALRTRAGAITFFGASLWIFFYALELITQSPYHKFLWNRLEYIGIVAMPTAWLIYILSYTRKATWVTGRNILFWSLIPAVTLLLVFTNDFHGLIWSSSTMPREPMFLPIVHKKGPWLLFFTLYSYALLLISAFLLAQVFSGQRRHFRLQINAVLAAMAVLAGGHLLRVSHVFPVDPQPFAIAIACAIVAFALFKLRFGDAVPLAHRVVVQGLSDSVMVLDNENLILEVNEALTRFLGQEASFFLGRTLEQAWPDHPPHAAKNPSKEPLSHVFEHVHEDKKLIFDLRVDPLFDERGQSVGKALVIRDITLQKNAEQDLKNANLELDNRVRERTEELTLANESMRQEIHAHEQTARQLRKSEENIRLIKDQWERIFHAIEDRVTLQDKQMRIVLMNKAAEREFGADSLGKTCHLVFHEKQGPCSPCPITADTTQTWYGEVMEQEKNGRVFQVAVSPVFGVDGEFEGFVRTAKDVTQQKHLENQLRQTQKMDALGTLAGGIAHDFNNLLVGIILNTEHALAHVEEPEKAGQALGLVLETAQSAKDLVGRILTFGRPGDDPSTSLAVGPILRETIRILRASLPSSIRFETHIQTQGAHVRVSKSMLQQVLINLGSNAALAMEEKPGTLRVDADIREAPQGEGVYYSALEPGPCLCIGVGDTGRGMDSALAQRIFEPFFTTRPAGRGTGMGLSVVLGIVKRLEGAIRLKTEPGQGATMEVFLPLSTPEKATPAELKRDLPQNTGRIFVVDDQRSVVESLKRVLTDLGHEVTGFLSPRQALEELRENPGGADLVMTDLTMPDMSGMELAKELHGLRPDLPIILCTGYNDLVEPEKARETGIITILKKPMSTSQLQREIQEAMAGQE